MSRCCSILPSKGLQICAHIVPVLHQQSISSVSFSIDASETSPPKSKGQSPAEQSSDHSADANISKRDPEADASVKQVKEGQSGADGTYWHSSTAMHASQHQCMFDLIFALLT